MKRIIITLLLLIGVQAHAVDYDVLGTDLDTIEWVEYDTDIYHVLWSDIGGIIPPTSALILEYLMGANGSESTVTLDTSGNSYTGAVSGATWVDSTNGVIHNYDFDGTDEIYRDDATPFLFTSDFTVSAWVNGDDVSGTESMVSLDVAAGSSFWFLKKSNANGFVRINDGSVDVSITDGTITAGNWHHLVMVAIDSVSLGLYIDGSLVATNALGDFNFSSGANDHLIIGKNRKSGTQQLFGGLWGVEIYNEALDASTVWATNRAQAVTLGIASKEAADLDLSPVLDVTFSGGTVQDGSTNYFALIDSSTTLVDMGVTNAAREFNGSSARVLIPASVVSTVSSDQVGAMSCWFRTAGNGTTMRLLGLSDGGDNNSDLGLIFLTTGSKLSFLCRDESGGGNSLFVQAGANEYLDDLWHHVVMSVSTNGNLLWVDGQEAIGLSYSTGDASTQKWCNDVSGLDAWRIGQNVANSAVESFYEGDMDEVQQYSAPMTTNDIKSLFYASEPKFGQLAGIRDESWFDNLVGLYTWNARNSGKSQDYSGNGNHGTDTSVTKTAFNWEGNGTTSKSDMGDVMDMGSSNFTVMAWINTTDTARQKILSKKPNSAAAGWHLEMNALSAGDLRLAISDGVNVAGNANSTNLNDGAWHHVAVAFNRNTWGTFYVDGIEDGQININPANGSVDNASPFLVGAVESTAFFDGNIDNVMIFEGLLTSNEIYNIYTDYPQSGQ